MIDQTVMTRIYGHFIKSNGHVNHWWFQSFNPLKDMAMAQT